MLDPHAPHRARLVWCGLGALLGMLLAAALVCLMLASEPEPARRPGTSTTVGPDSSGPLARGDSGDRRDRVPHPARTRQPDAPSGSDVSDGGPADAPDGAAERIDPPAGAPAPGLPAAPDTSPGTTETSVAAGAEGVAAGGDPGVRAEGHEPDWLLKRDPVAVRDEFIAKYADQLNLLPEQRRIFERIVAEHQSHPEHPGVIWGYFDVYREFRVYLTAEQARRFDEITPTAR